MFIVTSSYSESTVLHVELTKKRERVNEWTQVSTKLYISDTKKDVTLYIRALQ